MDIHEAGIVKNQYFGDRNDYFKYDLLIFMAEQITNIKRLSIIWMLTEYDKSGDGQRVNYKRSTGDSSLYQFLHESLNLGARNVQQLEHYFKAANPSFKYCDYGAERLFLHQDRESYFREIPEGNFEKAVIFLDPDNGLEVKSLRNSGGNKYVTYGEVGSIYKRMDTASVLVIYQHLPRIHRKLSLYRIFNQIVENLRCPIPAAISDNQIAFILLAKTKKKQSEIRNALREYARSYLEIID